jgi:hypothetical protein
MVSNYIRSTAVKLGIISNEEPASGFHNFRYALATFLISEGQNPDVVRRGLRHSHIDTTLLYAHMDAERIGAAGQIARTHAAQKWCGSEQKPASTGPSTVPKIWMSEDQEAQVPCYDSFVAN